MKPTVPIIAAISLPLLAACGGGGSGGGGSIAASGGSTSTGGGADTSGGLTITTPGAPPVSISAPGDATLGGNSPNLATGYAFTPASAPPVGTVLSFRQSALEQTQYTVSDAGIGGGTLVISHQSPSNAPSVTLDGELKIPAISLDIPIFLAGLNGATSAGIPNGGGEFNSDFGAMTYTLLGRWDYHASNLAGSVFGYSLGGFQTPPGGVPTAGLATYNGAASTHTPAGGVAPTIDSAGGVVGVIAIPDPIGLPPIEGINVAGNASVTVNFANGTVTGSLNHLQYVSGGLSTKSWNDVTLTGSLSGAEVSGTTAVGAPATDSLWNFSNSATGKFNGALYGPNGQEIGAIWSLYDPSGKTALGAFVAKQ